MKMYAGLAIALLAGSLLINGCRWGCDPHDDEQTNVAFKTIAHQQYGPITQGSERVIRTDAEWSAIWGELDPTVPPMPNVPVVDFSKEIVIAVFQGWKPSGGYDIEITGITLKDGKVTVDVKSVEPTKGCIVTEALTAPYHIVKLDKRTEPISFFKRMVKECNPG